MRRAALNRYERDGEGNIIIDVTATRVNELYNDFDKSAPYIRRDLDPDLADYLTGCARELGRAPFLVRFTLVHPHDEEKISRIRRSLNTYFLIEWFPHRKNVLIYKRLAYARIVFRKTADSV